MPKISKESLILDSKNNILNMIHYVQKNTLVINFKILKFQIKAEIKELKNTQK